MEYKEKEVSNLVERLVSAFSKEFEKTKDLGMANHFLAFVDFYATTLLFFFTASGGDESAIKYMEKVIKDETRDAKKLCKAIMEGKKDLN